MTAVASRLDTLSLVCVPVRDQDRAIAFYESIGFEKRTDTPFGNGSRWVEVYPPNGTTGIALTPPPANAEVGGKDTGIIVTTADVDAAHAQFKSLGIDVDAQVARMGDPVPPIFWLRDPERNSLAVVQPRS